MAKDGPRDEPQAGAGGRPEFSERDKATARQWFAKAQSLRERRDYDYAIECFITGLGFWTEAVEEGHMPLWSVAIQRAQAGGKKPSVMESLKHSMTAKDPKVALLNAEHLLAKDPTNTNYLDGVLKNAHRANLPETLRWIAPKVLDSLRKDKKPNLARFRTFRQVLVEAGDRADQAGDPQFAAWCYGQAVDALDYLVARNPTDMTLKDEQRDLSGKLTIARGKYAEADTFRDSLLDGDKQKLLHDSERAKQAEETLESLIEAERREYEANPTIPGKIYAYVDALLKPERKREEDIAIDVLLKAYDQLGQYSFKQRADDIRLRQLRRQTRRWQERAQQTGSAEDQQQARLAALEERQTEIEIYRERVRQYPTDLRLKYNLGRALFDAREYDEAIPLLQEAAGDPRNRVRARRLIGRAFYETGAHVQAAELLQEALESHEVPDDDLAKEMMYWLGRAHEAAGKPEDAQAAYGKLLRLDYNYADGDVRRRLERLRQTGKTE